MTKLVKSAEEKQQAAVQRGLWSQLQLFSRNLIYTTMMRSGGEPFGAPFEAGVPTLTERIVKVFRQKGFFSFETLEKLRARTGRNKYTRHGAAPYRGPYVHLPAVQESRGVVDRFVAYLRDNRFFLFTGRPNQAQPSSGRRPTAAHRVPDPSDLL